MRRGRPLKPTISLESVHAALKSLDYNTLAVSDTQALENLLLVGFRLQNSARPAAEGIHGWMLRKILTEMLLSILNQHRNYFDLQPVTLNNSRAITLRQIKEDFKTDSEHLKGWSLLYCRYVRPELNFSTQELAENTHTHERTLRRYQENAIQRLRDTLIESEWNVRKLQQKSYLRSFIPTQLVNLIGRDADIKTILTAFQLTKQHPIIISGSHGLGKSALVASIADSMIERAAIDYFVWIQQPQEFSHIPNRIHDILSPYPSKSHWRETLEFQKLLLVIDGIEHLDVRAEEWSELLIQLQSAFVVIINHEKPIFAHNVQHIELDNLSQADSKSLIKTYLDNRVDAQFVEQFVDEIGGNPGNLLHAIQYVSGNQIQNKVQLASFHKERFESLTDTRQVQHVLAHINQGVLTDVPTLIPENEALNDFDSSDSYAKFIENRYRIDKKLQKNILTFIDNILEQDNIPDTFLLNVASTNWLNLNSSIVQKLLEKIDLYHISIGRLNHWRSTFELHFGLNTKRAQSYPILSYQYGIALRRMHTHNAESYLGELIEEFGKNGQFKYQMQSLFELAMLFQAEGQLSKAQRLYHRLRQYLQRYDVMELPERIAIQLARIEIEHQDGAEALIYLEGLNLENYDVYVLYCEAHLLIENYNFIFSTIPQKLRSPDVEILYRASLHTILGRAFQRTDQHSESIIQFNEALSLVEQNAGTFDIARARNNLGSSYLTQLDNLDEIVLEELEEMFIETRQLQTQIQDAIGLEASNRNLTYLRHYHLN